MLNIITAPTALQAKRKSDGSLTVAITDIQRDGYMSVFDYYRAEANGLITIHVTEPIGLNMISVNYSVN